MATIYKLQKENGALSKQVYTKSGAIAKRKLLESKGIKTKVVVYKENVLILDTITVDTVESYRENYFPKQKRKDLESEQE